MKKITSMILIFCFTVLSLSPAFASEEPAADSVSEPAAAAEEPLPPPEEPEPLPEETSEPVPPSDPVPLPPDDTGEAEPVPEEGTEETTPEEPLPGPEEQPPEPEESMPAETAEPLSEAGSGEPAAEEAPEPGPSAAPAGSTASRPSAHPTGSPPETLENADVTGSVAEAGYFPSRDTVLERRYSGVFLASMILWHRDNGASCCRVKDTTVFAGALGGTPSYTPRPGDLIFYQNSEAHYEQGLLENHDFHHTGIVSEVGEDYIKTIEGNTGQSVSLFTWTCRSCGGDFRRAWIVDVFGEDEGARNAFTETALQALADAQADRRSGRCGFGLWCETGGQNDTIASGYFGMAAPWCEMFVLWCAFHAQLPREGLLTMRAASDISSVNRYEISAGGRTVATVYPDETGTASVCLPSGEYEVTPVMKDMRFTAQRQTVCLDRFGADLAFTPVPVSVPGRTAVRPLPGGMDLA